MIPWPYRLLALVLLVAALLGFGWIKGAEHVQAQWDAAVQQQTLQATVVRPLTSVFVSSLPSDDAHVRRGIGLAQLDGFHHEDDVAV